MLLLFVRVKSVKWKADVGSSVNTWTESVETSLRFNGVPDTSLAAILRRCTLALAAVRPVAARDGARVPLRPITELNDRALLTDWSSLVTCVVT